MSDITTISVSRRENVGKGAARAARRAGIIPAVVYGTDAEPISVGIQELELNRLIKQTGFFSQLFQLDVEGDKMNVLARDLQVHPVTDRAMHVDFLRVAANATITVSVPAAFINEDECPGLREGGILNVVRYDIEVSCRPDAIPEQIEVDLTGFQVGDSIHISSVSLPEGVEVTITDRDFTIATIAAPTKVVETAEETAAAGSEEETEDADESASEE
ncbi:MAG: 50S ribosomal protein L25/general stress protein Ctc [Rhodospirillales bacterium]